jgi:iron complex outermembrane receptor protein
MKKMADRKSSCPSESRSEKYTIREHLMSRQLLIADRGRARTSRLVALATAVSLASITNAHAQVQTRAEVNAETASSDDIVITGSRIVRDGFEAPTPTTVLGEAEINAAAPNNIADVVNRMPSLAGSSTPRTNLGQISNGGTGINALNLRNLGAQRTLILLDGKRVPVATINTGLVDVNFMPNMLIKRVDVVTGGASAAWGSDAVGGVVNFVLDTDFTGIKGDVQGGITTYGDDASFRVGLAAGTRFADGRGHIMFSAEHAYTEGLRGWNRPWYQGTKRLQNPDYVPGNGQPQWLVANGVGFTTVAPGAIVTAGPLKGVYFGEGGRPAQLNTGAVTDPFTVGGDWEYTDFGSGIQDMDPEISRWNAFARASYELSDRVKVYGQFMYGLATTSMRSTPQFNFGGITIRRDNAFLPGEIGTRMDELGLTTLTVGSWNADLGGIKADTERSQYRYMIGLAGGLDAFGSEWNWDVAANRNLSKIFNGSNATITSRYRGGIDAVRNDDGVIVCRSTLTNPNDGCVPYNILGTGTVSDAAKNYVLGDNWLHGSLTQDIYTATISGEPLSTAAGPVSIAMGVEHRRESLESTVDTLSLSNAYWAGNYKPINGSYSVSEAFVETLIPVIKDGALGKDLSLNAAFRATDYSTSGFVQTWKLGINYEPVEGVRFRASRSRDIRAGNFSELYASGQTNTNLMADPFRNNEAVTYFEIKSGNPQLAPEKADTLGIGVVLQPRFLPGFSASVDYFDIRVKDAVATVGAGTIVNECFRGDQRLCDRILRDSAGLISEIYVTPVNLASQTARGIDFEVGYTIPLAAGTFSLRAMATHYLAAESSNGTDRPSSSLDGSTRRWQHMFSGSYRDDLLTATLTGRGVSASKLLVTGVECQTACPVSTAENQTINNNRIAGALYWDAYLGLKAVQGAEFYVVVDNLLNKAPALVASGPSIGSAPYGSSANYYDLIGRTIRAGVRFKL